jgi:hypothetical protein
LILPIVPGGARNRVAGVRRVKPIENWFKTPIVVAMPQRNQRCGEIGVFALQNKCAMRLAFHPL